jgi:lambda family phage portal protein
MANIFERALAVVSPKSAARRAAYRRQFDLLDKQSRAYVGASRGRRVSGWSTQASAADAEIATGGPMLVQRSRDLVRNNPFAAKIVTAHADNMVGAGIVPRAATGVPATDKLINDAFDRWTAYSATDRTTDFYGQQYLAVRGMIEGGNIFARKRLRRSKDVIGTTPEDIIAPLQIQLLEADYLDTQKNGPVGRNLAVMGVEFDRIGQRRGYWMFQQHPGATVNDPSVGRESKFIKAGEVAHLFEPQRQQTIGAPWLAPIIIPLRDLDDYDQSELVRKKIESCLVGVVIPDDNSDNDVVGELDTSTGLTDADGFPVERFEPGMFAYARGGKDIKFNTPAASIGVEAYLRTQLHRVAAGARLPYELMTGDFSQGNFSLNRMGLIQYRRFVEHVQWHIIIPQLCQPVWDWFIEALKLVGGIPDDLIVPVKWCPPRHEYVSPLEETKADVLAVRAGIKTMQEVIGSTGRTVEEVQEEIIEWNAAVDAAGIVLDTDPRKVAMNGQLQFEQSDESDDGTAPASDTKQGKSDGKKKR